MNRPWRKTHRLIALTPVGFLLLAFLTATAPASARPVPTTPAPSAAASSTGSSTTVSTAARATLDLDLYEAQVQRLVNQRRVAHHLSPVRRISPCVDRFSEGWAGHLADTGDFVHRDQRVILRRCHTWWAGEALARGTAMTPDQAVTAWMRSAEHRPILLKRRANRGGIGARLDGEGRIVLVLNFADNRS